MIYDLRLQIEVPSFANPSVANQRRGKTRQGATDVASRSFGQVEAYFYRT
jgi:hypothetical protein